MHPKIFVAIGCWGFVCSVNVAQEPNAAPTAPLLRLGSQQFRHGAEVTALAFSGDRKWLASGGTDNLIHIWDAKTGERLSTLKGHTQVVTRIEFIPGNQRLLSGSLDGSIRLWNLEQSQELQKLIEFTPKVKPLRPLTRPETPIALALAHGGKLGIFVGPDQILRVWDISKVVEVKCLAQAESTVVALAISGDEKYAVSCMNTGMEVWNLTNGHKIYTERMLSFSNMGPGADFSPDGKMLALASNKGIKIFDLPNMNLQATLPYSYEFGPPCNRLMFSHHGHLLLTYTAFKKGILVYGVQSRTLLRNLNLNLPVISCWSLSADNKVLALAEKGGDIILWDLANDKTLNPIGHSKAVEYVLFSHHGKTLFTCAGCEIRAWDIATGQLRGRTLVEAEGLAIHATLAGGAALFSAQGQSWQQATWDGLGTPHFVKKVEEGFGAYWGHIAVSPRGSWLAILGNRSMPHLTLWNANTAQLYRTLSPIYQATPPIFSGDERFLAQIAGSHLFLYDTVGDREKGLRLADGFDEEVSAFAFSADSRLMAIALKSQPIPGKNPLSFKVLGHTHLCPSLPRRGLYCLELATQQIRYHFPDFTMSIEALAFSPDGRYLAVAAGPSHGIHLLELSTGKEVELFSGHRGRVIQLTFSSQGYHLLSGSADTTALLWDLSFLRKEKMVHKLTFQELETFWQDLALSGGPKVHEAIFRLSENPVDVVPFLKIRVKTLTKVDPKKLAQYVIDLDDDDFMIREKAMIQLGQWIDEAAPLLSQLLTQSRSPEAVGRARLILGEYKAHPEYVWREFRALEVLEKMKTPAAQGLLQSLAKDLPTSQRACEAQAAIRRLDLEFKKPGMPLRHSLHPETVP